MNIISGDYPQPELLPPLTALNAPSVEKDRRKIPSLFDLRFPTSTTSSSSVTSLTTGLMSDAGVQRPPPVSVELVLMSDCCQVVSELDGQFHVM